MPTSRKAAQEEEAKEAALWHDLTPAHLKKVAKDYIRADLKSEAIRVVLQAVRQRRQDPAILTVASDILRTYTQRFDIAQALQAKILSLDPSNQDVGLAYAETLVMDRKLSEGMAVFANLLQRFPEKWLPITVYLGKTLIECGYYQPALEILLPTFRTVYDKKGLLCDLIAVALGALNRSQEALAWHKKAIERAPDAQSYQQNYALSLLKCGDYGLGWRFWQKRPYQCLTPFKPLLTRPALTPQTVLKGQSVALYQEQGLGDTLQFIRFLPLLQQRDVHITLCVVPVLRKILSYSFPGVDFCPMQEVASKAEQFDLSLAIPDLPYICGVKSARDIPKTFPYLHIPKSQIERFSALEALNRPRIGICWAGGQRPESYTALIDRRRSIPHSAFMDAVVPSEATLVNLNYADQTRSSQIWKGQKIYNPMVDVHDFADTAAIIAYLDLVISVDTSVVHLAGGLDFCPIWLISRPDSCWRWGDHGTRTAWYPQMRIFRSENDDFGSVLLQVKKELSQWVAQYRRGGVR